MWNPLIILVAVVAAAVGLSGQASSSAVTDRQAVIQAVCPRMDDVRPVQEDPCQIGHIVVAAPPLDLHPVVIHTTVVQTPHGPITESVCFDNCPSPLGGPHNHNLDRSRFQ
jgi:hypothetical protein